MAKWAGEGIPPITGTKDCFTIYQLSAGKWYVRMRSSITGKRILKDPVFKGFRNSSFRMKDASPIASKIYQQLPVKVYPLFKEITGKALLLLKAGFTASEVERQLVETYLAKPVKRVMKRVRTPFPRIYKVLPAFKEPSSLLPVYSVDTSLVRGLYGDG